ncbi:palmitoyltransferase ZDHHC6 [Drosophila ficusphila]|uniref:palmitoyltransferase ZDHHC6 n=1 Tax=Drosophila ficusphila TaxID=30025 RepID=UPI0007E82A47|nr:palmitoyltransferase ZDHHC6 [Drosophila ficusphila]
MSCDLKDDLRRFLHWGPITLFSLTLFVTWTVIEMNSMWWAPGETFGSVLNYSMIWFLTFGTLHHFVKSLIVGPGFIPLEWHPESVKDTKFLQFCLRCEGYKPPRSHHCRRCDRCVMKMDHHCPWINTCVGHLNQDSFIYFLLFFLAASIHGGFIIVSAVIRGLSKRWLIRKGFQHLATVHLTYLNLMACMLSFGITTGAGLACIKLLYMQIKEVLKNQTEIESWIVKKAVFRRNAYPGNRIKPFVFPYNLGWRENLREVFWDNGDGISWPVLPGCNQYTLTREQLEQKKDKRARTRLYKCIRPATGHWVPIFSQGLWISLKIPCTDDPRIILDTDDLIQVTRISDYWLYGERIISEEEKERGLRRKGAIRGWFPARCAIEIINEEFEKEEEMDYMPAGEPFPKKEVLNIKSGDAKEKKTNEETTKNHRIFQAPSSDGKPRKRLRVK